jgi:hypothetical protein
MLFVDRMIMGGVRWVLGKVAAAVEAEIDDDGALRQELLDLQLELELGQITEEEFRGREEGILRRLHELLRRRQGGPQEPHTFAGGTVEVEGFEGAEGARGAALAGEPAAPAAPAHQTVPAHQTAPAPVPGGKKNLKRSEKKTRSHRRR